MNLERKLKPIYAALDAGNDKAALKLLKKITKVNQKNKTSSEVHPVFHALTALTLFRLRRMSDCWETISSIFQSTHIPSDETFLSTMLMVFKLLGRLDLGCLLYERACRENPTCTKTLEVLYFAYARAMKFCEQQKTASKLNSMVPTHPDYFSWIIVSLLGQASGSTDDNKRSMYFKLAYRHMDKRFGVGDSGFSSMKPLERGLFLKVLYGLEQYGTGIELISTLTGIDAVEQVAMVQWQVSVSPLITETSQLELLKVSLLSSISGEFKDYSVLQALHSIMVSLHQLDVWVDMLISFKESREVLLASIHSASHLPSGNFSLLTLSVVKYWINCGHKKCFLTDLQGLPVDLPRILEILDSNCSDIMEDLPLSKRRKCVLMYISLLLDESTNPSSLVEYLYDVESTSDLDIECTEDGLYDDLIALATYVCISRGYILDACVLCKWACSRHPNSWILKLALLKAYVASGSIDPAFESFLSLDVKHVQFESMSYLILDEAVRLGRWDYAYSVVSCMVNFHSSYTRDAPEMVVLAYRERNLQQAINFTEFHSRMINSVFLRYATSLFDFARAAVPFGELLLDCFDDDAPEEFITTTVTPIQSTPSLNCDLELLRGWHCLSIPVPFLVESKHIESHSSYVDVLTLITKVNSSLSACLSGLFTSELPENLEQLQEQLALLGVNIWTGAVPNPEFTVEISWNITCRALYVSRFIRTIVIEIESSSPSVIIVKSALDMFKQHLSDLHYLIIKSCRLVCDLLPTPSWSILHPLSVWIHYALGICIHLMKRWFSVVPASKSIGKRLERQCSIDLSKVSDELSTHLSAFDLAIRSILKQVYDRLEALNVTHEYRSYELPLDIEVWASLRRIELENMSQSHNKSFESLARSIEQLLN